MKRLLFFDIDGTLTMPGCPPSRETADAIRKARGAGHMAFLSTGRALEWVEPAVLEIGFDGGIFHAGGRCLIGSHCISEHRMPEHLVRDGCSGLGSFARRRNHEITENHCI